MLMFLILSLFVCCASSAPQVYQEYPREFERSQWAEDRIRRMEFSSTPQAFVEYPSESDRIKWAEERIKRTEAERERTIRIVGGSNAQPNQFRHAAALFLTLTNRLDSFCGGSIIHVNFILTAAHCLDDLVSIEVIAGTTNIFARGTPPYRQIVPAADTRQHPGYDRTTLRDDIGLLCLRRSVPSNSQIGTIRLPTRSMANMNFAARSVQERPFVIGWGRTADGELKTQPISVTCTDKKNICLNSKSKSFGRFTIYSSTSHRRSKLHRCLQHILQLFQPNN